MNVEDITGIGFTSRRAPDQQRHGTVSDRVLGQVIIDNEDILALLHEVFRHGNARIGSDILQRSRLSGSSSYHDGVIHGAGLFQAVYYTQDGGVLLTNGDIDTDHILAALVDNGINTNGSLTGLLIADDQLTLTLTDGDHRVDGLDTGLDRLDIPNGAR